MADPQGPESFPPEAQAVIVSLRLELNERNQELNERNQQLQQALNEKSQLVLERDLLVNQLQAQRTQRHGLEAQVMIASQNDTAVKLRGTKRAHTEMEEEATTVPVVSNSSSKESNDRAMESIPVDEQTQVAPRTQRLVPTAQQVSQLHGAVTKMDGMMVTQNNEVSGMLGATGSPFNAEGRYTASNTGPFPVKLWTNVLGFLPYSDVCRMTQVAKVFREDVMDTLKNLYIDNDRAIFHDTSRRYYGSNVQELIFACFFEDFEPPVGDEPGHFVFQSWVHSSSEWFLDLFLVNFLKVKYIFIAKGNGETKQEILRRLSLQGDVEAGYDYVDSIPRGHINFVQPRDDGDDRKSASILRGLADHLFIDPALVHPNSSPDYPVRMVYGLPRVHRGNSCLGGGCNHDGCKYVPLVESKVHPGMFLPC